MRDHRTTPGAIADSKTTEMAVSGGSKTRRVYYPTMPAFGPVTMITSADPAMARVLRMTNMAIASSADLAVDRVDDVALATNEAFAAAIANGNVESVKCAVHADSGSVVVRMTPLGVSGSEPITIADPAPLTATVLRSVTHDVAFDGTTGVVSFTITNT